MAMAQDISNRKTFRQVIKGVRSNVCGIFGFCEVGVLFHDAKGKIPTTKFFEL